MDSSIISEGIKTILIVIGGVSIVAGAFFLFRRYRALRMAEKGVGLGRDKITYPQEIKELQKRIDGLDRRVNQLEALIRSMPSTQKQEGQGDGVALQSFPKGYGSLAEKVTDDFVPQMEAFIWRYRKVRLGTGSMQTSLQDNKVRQEVVEATSSVTTNKKVKSVNDMNLIEWWKRNAHNSLSVCRESLKEEFGDVYFEAIGGKEEDWNLIGVSNDGNNFYIIPRKGVWDEEIYQNWFVMEDGIVRPSEPIRTLRSPLPRAKREGLSGWKRLGVKGRVSIRESFRGR